MARRRVEKLRAPDCEYRAGDDALVLRGALTPKTRTAYQEIGGVREDAWQRRVEFLFERLVVSWTIAGAEPLSRLELARALARRVGGDPNELRSATSAGTGRPLDCSLDSSRAQALLRTRLRGVREALGL